MIGTLNIFKLLTPWQQGEELDDAVFRVAATFPLRELKHKNYMMPGDEYFGFDPNAFVQQLIDETGIPHVWEPAQTKVGEGGRHVYLFRRQPKLGPGQACKASGPAAALDHLGTLLWPGAAGERQYPSDGNVVCRLRA